MTIHISKPIGIAIGVFVISTVVFVTIACLLKSSSSNQAIAENPTEDTSQTMYDEGYQAGYEKGRAENAEELKMGVRTMMAKLMSNSDQDTALDEMISEVSKGGNGVAAWRLAMLKELFASPKGSRCVSQQFIKLNNICRKKNFLSMTTSTAPCELLSIDEVCITSPHLIIGKDGAGWHRVIFPQWKRKAGKWEPANRTARDLASGELVKAIAADGFYAVNGYALNN